MTIKQLHYFIAVAETKNFTHAARNYFIAQTAMSQQISALEKELGFLLFHRTNRMVELTPAGQILYKRVRPLVLDLERAIEKASAVAGVQGQIFRIGIFDQAINRFLAPALKEFAKQEPEVIPQLICDNQILLLESLTNGSLDVVMLGKQFYRPHTALVATELFTYRVLNHVLAVPDSHPLAQRNNLSWSDLDGLRLIAYSPLKEDQQGESLKRLLKQHSVSASIRLSTRDMASALLYVEAGLGCCLLPARGAELENPQVRMLPIDEQLLDTMLLLNHKNNDSHLIAPFTAICKRALHGIT